MGNFNILPPEIISNILTRLPTESVLNCKLVSTIWVNLIRHPSFCKMHSDRHINHLAAICSIDDSCKLGFLVSAEDQPLFSYFEYNGNHETPINKVRRINIRPPWEYTPHLIGSVNGLICFHERVIDGFYICNPITKEYVIIPDQLRKSRKYISSLIGFGYLLSTNEYKIVVLNVLKEEWSSDEDMEEPSSVEVMVYTLGSGKGWRNIGKFNLDFGRYNFAVCGNSFEGRGTGIFANGSLHWMHQDTRTILVFDLADENFGEHLKAPLLATHSCSSFGVLGGNLFCALHKYGSPIDENLCSDVWLYKKKTDMKEKYEQQSLGWSKEFSAAACSKPLAHTKSTNGVLCWSNRSEAGSSSRERNRSSRSSSTGRRTSGAENYRDSYLNIYDPKSSISKKIVDFEEKISHVFPHTNTLVSLKQLGEEGTLIMPSLETKKLQKRKRHD